METNRRKEDKRVKELLKLLDKALSVIDYARDITCDERFVSSIYHIKTEMKKYEGE
jgi:hypothetical protein